MCLTFSVDALCTLTTLLLLGVIIYISAYMSRREKISLWGGKIFGLTVLGLITCVFAAARDRYYMSVNASVSLDTQSGLFTVDSAQSVLCSFGGAVMLILAISCMFIKSQRYRKTMFFAISTVAAAKILLIETSRIGLL